MKKLIIMAKDNYLYTLVDQNKNQYEIDIEFLDDVIPEVNDTLYMHDNLLKEVNNSMLTLGYMDNKYGKTIKNKNDVDLVILVTKQKHIFLKRLYG